MTLTEFLLIALVYGNVLWIFPIIRLIKGPKK